MMRNLLNDLPKATGPKHVASSPSPNIISDWSRLTVRARCRRRRSAVAGLPRHQELLLCTGG
jgi:hypothetical protein